MGKDITIADFSVGAMLIYADAAGIPLKSFKNITRWVNKMQAISAWAEVPALAA